MDNVEEHFDGFLRKYQSLLDGGVPDELGLVLGVFNVPNAGKALICLFMWASTDFEAGRAMLDKMQTLGPIQMNTVTETTVAEWLVVQNRILPPYGVYSASGPVCILIPSFDEGIRKDMAKNTALLPSNPATFWVENHLHGAALRPKHRSCFGYRQTHILVEIIGNSIDEAHAQKSGEWALSFHKDLRECKGVFEGGYIVLINESIPSKLCYPGDWESLQKLKAKVDPDDQFRFSVLRLDGKM
jgi:hypothetical protein